MTKIIESEDELVEPDGDDSVLTEVVTEDDDDEDSSEGAKPGEGDDS